MADLSDLIAQLRAAAENATKGEWQRDNYNVFVDTREQVCCGRGYQECCGEPDIRGGAERIAESNEVDAAYIVAAQPQNITRILDAHAEMERALTFYADPGNWAHGDAKPGPALYERGARARAALQQKDKADE